MKHHHSHTDRASEHKCGEGRCGQSAHGKQGVHATSGSGWRGAASVTLHCLTGCLIGEWIGLAIGVAFSLHPVATSAVATLLAYASGFALTMLPLLRSRMPFVAALRAVFVGEAVSIGAMEIVMNLVDWQMGGMTVKSLFAARYWEALSVAAVAGFLAAWPVNAWLLSRNLKNCHAGAAHDAT